MQQLLPDRHGQGDDVAFGVLDVGDPLAPGHVDGLAQQHQVRRRVAKLGKAGVDVVDLPRRAGVDAWPHSRIAPQLVLSATAPDWNAGDAAMLAQVSAWRPSRPVLAWRSRRRRATPWAATDGHPTDTTENLCRRH